MKNRGITLIALVVTIVVLLILAGVSISMLTGEKGIITQAKKSKEQTIIGEEKDAIAIAYNGCKINNKQSQVTSEELETELRNNGENASVETDGNELIITFIDTNNKYTITETGKVEYQKPLTPEEAEKIVSAGLINETYMYVETAGGEVRIIENTETTEIEEVISTNATVLTTNGIRKKDKNCLIDKKGNVYTWGENEYGELGNGTTEESSVPICISDIEGNTLKGKKITDIYSTIYTVIARDNEGKIYTWGANWEGVLGNGTTENSNVPICISDIEGNLLKGKNIVDIYTDGATVVAKDINGKIYTWGYNCRGQLGDGTTETGVYKYRNVPICISDIEGNLLKGKNIVDIYTDGATVVAKDINGKIYTWGYNNRGQLGNGTTEDSDVPICISDIEGNTLKGKKITDIYTNGSTLIARDNEGKIYTWGYNNRGQLGNGTTENSNVPICISDIEGNALNGKNIVDIYVGGYRVIARDNVGKIYTWGWNYCGKLGNGTTEDSDVPICISNIQDSKLYGKKIVDIYGVGIVKDNEGKIYTWGNNSDGQLGNGTTTDSSLPICISDETILENKSINHIIFDVLYNYYSIFYITTDGQVYRVDLEIMFDPPQ